MASGKLKYIPGACNIGNTEIKRRQVIGWGALFACIVLWAAFIFFKVAAPWRLLLFVPATIAAGGFLQATWRFCAKYGLQGVSNVGPTAGTTDSVVQAEFRRQDRRTALRIIGWSVFAGLAVAMAAYFLPL